MGTDVKGSIFADFVDKILSVGQISPIEIDGRLYTKENLHLILSAEDTPPAPLEFRTLAGLTGYLLENIDSVSHSLNDGVFMHVFDFDKVNLQGNLNPSGENRRFLYATAKLGASAYPFGQWLDIETFIISMQSLFVQDETTESILSVIGNLASDLVVENKDDGLSQSVQIKTGITTKSQVKITNPVTLRPFRTFREVDQPASKFVFRLRRKDGLQFSLSEADGGAWKIEAIKNIKAWLAGCFPSGQTELHKIIVIG